MAQTVKNLPARRETQVRSLGQEAPLERGWEPTPVFLPGESHGWRSLAGYSPWGHRVRHNWATDTLCISIYVDKCVWTCMYVCIFVHICVCLDVYVGGHVHIVLYVSVYVCILMQFCVFTCLCFCYMCGTRKCLVYTYVCVHVYMYYMYVCTCLYVCILM